MATMPGRFSRSISAGPVSSNGTGSNATRRGRSPKPLARRPSSSLHHIVILGDKGVGKSAMVVQLLSHRFIYEYDSSADSLYSVELMAGDHASRLTILDVASKLPTEPSEIEAITDKITDIGSIVLVYSVTDARSFELTKKLKILLDGWRCSATLPSHIPIFLVGNKTDLAQRVVSFNDGLQAADDLSFQRFHEISAMNGHQVDQVFVDLVHCMRAARKGEGLPKVDAQSCKTSPHLERSGAVSPSHFGSIPEIRSDDYSITTDAHESETNALKRLISTLKHLPFISPLQSPSTSPKSSPKTSPRTLSPRSSQVVSPPSPPMHLSPTMGRRRTLPAVYPSMLSSCV